MLAFIPEAASREYSVPLPKSRPGQRKRTRNLCDRFGIQDQGRERPVLTLLNGFLGHFVRARERQFYGCPG